MITQNFEETNSVLNTFISEIRDDRIQKDSMRFRRNIERVGEVLSYEMSKSLSYKTQTVTTPLGIKEVRIPDEELVICSVLRAGLPLHQGILNYFDRAENAFISAFRKHINNTPEFEVVVNYFASPSLEGKVLILTDPMLATGKTLENVYKVLKTHGTPKSIHIVSLIGSQLGVDYIENIFRKDTQLWIASIDNILDKNGYIIPGIGDAGDLAFGQKL
jgi:uracil phosphoribosyltransferase